MGVWRIRVRRVAHSGTACGAFGYGVWRVWVRRVARLGTACGAFGYGVWRIWVRRVARSGWVRRVPGPAVLRSDGATSVRVFGPLAVHVLWLDI
jgi:hypothetical protein